MVGVSLSNWVWNTDPKINLCAPWSRTESEPVLHGWLPAESTLVKSGVGVAAAGITAIDYGGKHQGAGRGTRGY